MVHLKYELAYVMIRSCVISQECIVWVPSHGRFYCDPIIESLTGGSEDESKKRRPGEHGRESKIRESHFLILCFYSVCHAMHGLKLPDGPLAEGAIGSWKASKFTDLSRDLARACSCRLWHV